MRLYSRTGATVVHHGDDMYEVDPDTSTVEVPDELGAVLQRQHFNGERAWEDDAERDTRLKTEDLARRRDPASIYDLLDKRLRDVEDRDELLALVAKALQVDVTAKTEDETEDEPEAKPAPRKTTPRKASSSK